MALFVCMAVHEIEGISVLCYDLDINSGFHSNNASLNSTLTVINRCALALCCRVSILGSCF